MMIKRFYRNRQYIGIDNQSKDACGNWQAGITANRFTGRPDGGQHAYDTIIEFSQAAWDHLIEKAGKQASRTSRKAIISDTGIFLAPVWIHGKQLNT